MTVRGIQINAKRYGLAALILAAAAGQAMAADLPVKAPPAPVVDVPFFLVNDNSVSFTWYPNATDPGVCRPPNAAGGGALNADFSVMAVLFP